ncbi:MAG: hypothetical protein V4580_19185 [Bacteroidota bacterium]
MTLLSFQSFAQPITKKNLSTKWRINLLVDSIKPGDTITFRKDDTYRNFHFKSNGDLKEHHWYAKCGNKFFLDNFVKKPQEWIRAGFWTLNTVDNNIILKMAIDEKAFLFRYMQVNENQLKFIFIE